MLKVIFTAAIVLSVGILSLLKTTTPEKPATTSIAKVIGDSRSILATAD